ncbi:hypothetical protein [Ruegeria jejuensis]|uniref:hypothetical protein n=1 Tax=Ruegeria jejuensis TaxID=3233338 RepID=UPI00355C9984
MTTARNLVLGFCLLALPASAQDVGKALEMPAHRTLMALRATAELRPFETDGCSGGLSSSWELVAETFPDFEESFDGAPPWEDCCVTHDRAYHDASGTQEADQSYEARLVADQALRACVVATGAEQEQALADRYDVSRNTVRQAYANIAGAMFLAVRFGGGPCSGLPWRWGYGYPSCDPFGWTSPARD